MARLTYAAYRQHLADETSRAAAVLGKASPDADVPGCPGWQLRDLLDHLLEMNHVWAWLVANRPRGVEEYQTPHGPQDHDKALAVLAENSQWLQDVLARSDPAEPAHSWTDDRTVGFAARLMAHETLIHRLDAEQAAGVATTPLPAGLAADGIEHMLSTMLDATSVDAISWDDDFVRVDTSDTGDSTWIRTGWDPEVEEYTVRVLPPPRVQPVAVVAAPAATLLPWLWWRNPDDTPIDLTGDEPALVRFRRALLHPVLSPPRRPWWRRLGARTG